MSTVKVNGMAESRGLLTLGQHDADFRDRARSIAFALPGAANIGNCGLCRRRQGGKRGEGDDQASFDMG
jgi:hypothetical protein